MDLCWGLRPRFLKAPVSQLDRPSPRPVAGRGVAWLRGRTGCSGGCCWATGSSASASPALLIPPPLLLLIWM